MNGRQPEQAVFIDPSSKHFLEDRLFDVGNAWLNRDGTLLPFARLKEALEARGIPVHTADALRSGRVVAKTNHYFSLGLLDGYQPFLDRSDVRMRGFILLEPPLVYPHMYKALPRLTRDFEAVFVHNTIGDGYSLRGVDATRLRQLHWPQPYDREVEPYWSNEDRQDKLVVIAGNHNAWFKGPELYSERIRAVAELARTGSVDLYGRGWSKWYSKQSAWPPYWRHRKALMASYRGEIASKLEVLSRYRFCLCLENMEMTGYLTEKIFDCLYAGTIPVYLGAPDVAELVPPEAYIDLRRYDGYTALIEKLRRMSRDEAQRLREAGRDFLRTTGKARYFASLIGLMSP